MSAKRKQQIDLDFSFANSANLVLPSRNLTRLYLVGCGGTGSWIAPALARLASVMAENNLRVELYFIDPDRVERKNVPRQNFGMAEVGAYKAAALARRFSSKWGVEVRSVCEPFDEDMISFPNNKSINIIIGAADNAEARCEMATCLNPHRKLDTDVWYMPDISRRTFWLDCGNHEDSGQVLLGNAFNAEDLKGAFHGAKMCLALPSPALQSPDLLQPEKVKRKAKRESCAEMMLANAQSLTVNQRVAAEASDYLMRMLTGKPLRRFQTWMDLEAGTSRSVYITPEILVKYAGKGIGFVMRKGI